MNLRRMARQLPLRLAAGSFVISSGLSEVGRRRGDRPAPGGVRRGYVPVPGQARRAVVREGFVRE